MKRRMILTLLLSMSFVLSVGLAVVVAQPGTPPGLSTDSIVLQLRSGAFDPLKGEPVLLATLSRALSPAQKGLRLVQFTGPIQDEWYTALTKAGLEIVTYLPDYAYLVWGDEAAIKDLQAVTPVRWSGAYQPFYALSPQLNEVAKLPTAVEVTVQLFNHADVEATRQIILEQATELSEPDIVLSYMNLKVSIASNQVSWLASLPDVVDVETAPHYQKMDEIQGQIMAGNLNTGGTQPSGPGYLAWLTGTVGLSTDPNAYPIVDVTDDGLDNGSATPLHPDFWKFGSTANTDRLIYNYNWSTDALADGRDGHGNINASIVAGYNDQSGFPYEDVSGATANYNFGLGINPFGRVAGSKVFNNGGSWGATASNTAIVSNSYVLGARISSNSWGCGPSGGCTGAPYSADSQEYDSLVRDAQPGSGTFAGNQPMIIVFAAGNDGSGTKTIGSPATAKNVLTVGASENYRPTAADGCSIATTGADNAQDIISFSSRGPTSDSRTKPDIMAPGTHIMGAASQDASYDGSGVCGGTVAPVKYYPTGQTLYTWSSGTSHSTPAVSGAASLIYRFYQDHFGGQPPSPAMLKAYLINSARYLTGVSGSGNLPTTAQGFGEVYLGQAFDNIPRLVVDQSTVFGSSGQVYQLQGSVANTGKPYRVTLAWTDAPGPTTGNAYVNNLDLAVTVGGNTYRGNVFSGASSTTGGTADARNNVESVFLPAGVSGNFTLVVTATNIAGDGLPGNSDTTDQDFALVVYNANAGTPAGVLTGSVTDALSAAPIANAQVVASSGAAYTTTTNASGRYTLTNLITGTYSLTATAAGYLPGTAGGVSISSGVTTTRNLVLTPTAILNVAGIKTSDAGGNNNGIVEPGEVISLNIGLKNTGALTATNVNGVIALTGGNASLSTRSAAYANLVPAATVTNTNPFIFYVNPAQPCGQPLTFIFTSTYNTAQVLTYTFSISVGTASLTPQNFQNFDGVTAPTLPAGWTSTATGSQSAWVTQNNTSDSAPNNAYSPDPQTVGVNELVSAMFTPTTTAARITFRNNYSLESGYDGGVLEIKIGTSAFADILTAGGSFATGGYNGTISSSYSNPLAGRSAWTGNSSGYLTTTVNLPAPAAGQPVQLRWRVGSDSSVSGTAQRIDTIKLTDGSTCAAAPAALIWTGATSIDWFVASNWEPANVPAVTSLVIIPTAPTGDQWPIITGTAASDNLTLQPGAKLTIAPESVLVVDDALENNGTLAQIKNVPAGATTEFLHLTNAAGDADKYHGVDLTPAGAMGMTTVQVKGHQAACTTNPADPIVLRCYHITPATPAAATARFWFTEAERNNQAANALKLWHWGPWTPVSSPVNYAYSEAGLTCATDDGQGCWFQSAGVDSYSPFVLGSSTAPTAIQLTQVEARSESSLPALVLSLILLSLSIGLVVLKRRSA